jgi:signal transduction histidine kinase/CheY-like chemotaxis protein
MRHLAGEPFCKQTVKRRRRDGSFAHVNVSTAALFDGGRIRLVVVCFEDISRQVAIEEQLRQAQKMEAVGQLTGGLAHDFNNLLGIIVGNLDMLLSELEAQPDLHELADAAFRAALRGGELTRQLLAFSRRQPLQSKVTDVNDLVSTTVKLLRRLLGEDIRIKTITGAAQQVVVDQAQLGAILANIATNARDAMPNGGDLIIETGDITLDADYSARHPEISPGDYVCISLTDSGCGMTPEVLARAFEPFFTTKPVGKGTGLGLSMAYGFAKQSGGHLNIYSEPDHGTTVRLYLPRSVHSGAAKVDISASPVVPHACPGEVVLIVEDNADMRGTVVRQLTELGYNTIEAEDVSTTLTALAAAKKVDLLFTDIVMPGGMSGMDLARSVRNQRPEMRILFTSGFPDYASKGGWNADSGDRLLSKPYRKADLARAVRRALDGSS